MRGVSGICCVLSAGLVSAGTVETSPYGVAAHIGGHEHAVRDRTLQVGRGAGIDWFRGGIYYQQVRKPDGSWDFTVADETAASVAAAGAKWLPTLIRPIDPLDLNEWCEYVRRMVERYGRIAPAWEVWNEQNIAGFWKNPDPKAYAELLRRTHETIKAIDPKLLVVIGGFAHVPLDFIEGIYKAGGAKWFDVMNVHPYCHPGPPDAYQIETYRGLRELMSRYGDGRKPLWITEIGWPTHRLAMMSQGVLKNGLRIIDPAKRDWRIAFATGDRTDLEVPTVRKFVTEEAPGASFAVSTWRELPDALATTDVVILPLSGCYEVGVLEEIREWVSRGGTLAILSGAPLAMPMRLDGDGILCSCEPGRGDRDRARLRIRHVFNVNDPSVPKSLRVHPSRGTVDIFAPPEGITWHRLFTGDLLEPEDSLVPILEMRLADGRTLAGAGVYRYAGGKAGNLIFSGVFPGGSRASTEEDQAKMLARTYGVCLQLGYERIFWYELTAMERNANDCESHFGIVHADFSPKPAYRAYRAFTTARPAGSVNRETCWKNGAQYAPEWVRPDGRGAGMVWQAGSGKSGCATAVIRFKGEPQFADMYGRRIDVRRRGSNWLVPVSDAPVYFTGASIVRDAAGVVADRVNPR